MIKPIYLVWDDEAKRYIHNTTRDIGIYSSRAEEFFSREDLNTVYEEGHQDGMVDRIEGWKVGSTTHQLVEELIEHDGKPYKESDNDI